MQRQCLTRLGVGRAARNQLHLHPRSRSQPRRRSLLLAAQRRPRRRRCKNKRRSISALPKCYASEHSKKMAGQCDTKNEKRAQCTAVHTIGEGRAHQPDRTPRRAAWPQAPTALCTAARRQPTAAG